MERDEEKGASWLIKAASQGYARAQYLLAQCYLEGKGVRADSERALVLLRQAAEQGYPPAQRTMGQWYQEGKIVPRDKKKAAEWFRLAAEQGDQEARRCLDGLSGASASEKPRSFLGRLFGRGK